MNNILDGITTPEELLDFMSKNIKYGYLTKNNMICHYEDKDFSVNWYDTYILENTEDILKTKVGTCFDQTEFEREWFIRNNYEIKTIYEQVLVPYENFFPVHSFLIYKTQEKWNWFENSDSENRNIYSFDSLEKLLKYQYKCYVDLLYKYNITSQEVNKIIVTEFEKPKEHINAYSYIDFAINSKKIDIHIKNDS